MGQKKGLIYNCFVIIIFGVIWYTTTNITGYTVPVVDNIKQIHSPFSFEPTVFHIVLTSDEDFTIPDEISNSLKNIANSFSMFWDIKVSLSKIISSEPKKIKSMSSSPSLTTTLVFVISPKVQNLHKDHFYWIPENNLGKVTNIFISVLRNTIKFPPATTGLVNGLSRGEMIGLEKFAKDWILSRIFKEINLYNELNQVNQRSVSEKLYREVIEVQRLLNSGPLDDIDQIYLILKRMEYLNKNPELAQEESFQWDFKLGVYAPLFFPLLFPMSAAIYSRLFLRGKK